MKPSKIAERKVLTATELAIRERRVVAQSRAFLKGPIPLSWLRRASALGKAPLAVGLMLWFMKGLRSSTTLRVTNRRLASLGISERSASRALHTLAEEGLVSIAPPQRGSGRVITLLEVVVERDPGPQPRPQPVSD
ncbi:MAG: hypothetical protein JKY65_14880 [Planctomycetes bacterium]|nr:hypothetical protein [Planctomycetota bacterium]